jgi:heat shock protein HslJ
MSSRLLALALVVAAIASACASAGVSDPGAAVKLDGTSWKAILVAGQPPVAGREPTATFADARVQGTTGCNQYGGPYTQSDGSIGFGPLMSTMMGCEAAIGEVEGRFDAALNGADRVSFDADGRLVIDGTGGSVTFLAMLTTGG